MKPGPVWSNFDELAASPIIIVDDGLHVCRALRSLIPSMRGMECTLGGRKGWKKVIRLDQRNEQGAPNAVMHVIT